MIFFRFLLEWEHVGVIDIIEARTDVLAGLLCTFQDFGALKSLDEAVFVMHVIFLSRTLVEKAQGCMERKHHRTMSFERLNQVLFDFPGLQGISQPIAQTVSSSLDPH